MKKFNEDYDRLAAERRKPKKEKRKNCNLYGGTET
jgi:hypothetical protein